MYKKVIIGIVFGMATVVVLWDLLQIEAFDNALLQFATAGVVPGTHIVLSPQQVYVVLGALLIGVLMLLFHKGITRDLRAVRKALAAVDNHHAAAHSGEGLPTSAAPHAFQEPAGAATSGDNPAVVITIPGAPGLISKGAHTFRRHAPPMIAAGWAAFKRRSRQDMRALIQLSRRLALAVWRYMVRAWRYTEPRIRQFDAYLERTVKRNAIAAQLIREAGRFTTSAQEYVQTWREKRQRAVEK